LALRIELCSLILHDDAASDTALMPHRILLRRIRDKTDMTTPSCARRMLAIEESTLCRHTYTVYGRV
jgi:hypothetical protein